MAFWKSPVDSSGPSPSPLAPRCQVADLIRQTVGWVIVQHLLDSHPIWPTSCFVGVLAKAGLLLKENFGILTCLFAVIATGYDDLQAWFQTWGQVYNKVWYKFLKNCSTWVSELIVELQIYLLVPAIFTECSFVYNQSEGDGGRMRAEAETAPDSWYFCSYSTLMLTDEKSLCRKDWSSVLISAIETSHGFV